MSKLELIYYPEELTIIEQSPQNIEELISQVNPYKEISDEYIQYFWLVSSLNNYTKNKMFSIEEKRIRNIFDSTFPRSRRVSIATKIINHVLGFKITLDSSGKFMRIPLDIVAVIGYSKLTQSQKIINDVLYITSSGIVEFSITLYMKFLETILYLKKNEIISQLRKNKQLLEYLQNKYKVELPEFSNEPPCIKTIKEEGVSEGKRNNAIFALISFYKYIRENYGYEISDEEIENIVKEANEKFDPPLPENELNRMISYHLYGSGRYKTYNFCGFIRNNLPELCTSTPKECWRLMFKRKKRTSK